jgi:hypothetical protein
MGQDRHLHAHAGRKAQWRQAMLPVRKEMESRVGSATLAAIDNAAK